MKKIVVISGGMGYVGSAVARAAANADFVVALLYRSSSKSDVEVFLNTLGGSGHRAFAIDLAEEKEVEKILETIEREMGPVYACVHTAGEMPLMKQLNQLTSAEFKTELDKSLVPAFVLLSSVSRRLKEHKDGIIVGITTAGVATSHHTKARGIYSPIKFGLQGMLVALREELLPFGIKVYSVAPGVMPGGLNKKTPQAFLDMVREQIPDKKLVTAEEMAEKITQLLLQKETPDTMTVLMAPESKQ